MANFKHDPRIIEQADFLAALQTNAVQAMINMKPNEDTQTASHYYGIVERVVTETPEPYVDIQLEKLVIEYFSRAHQDAQALFSTLRAAREDVIKSREVESALNSDMALMDAIEKKLGVVHQDHIIELNGMPQRIAISGISTTLGLGQL